MATKKVQVLGSNMWCKGAAGAAGVLVVAATIWMVVRGGADTKKSVATNTRFATEQKGIEAFAPSKCYSCEKESCKAYPQKCFDCERNRSQEFWQSSHGSPRFFAGL